MRRVAVTGMGIVSSIGNTTQEVIASLREAKSGISRAEKYAELGFKCQVHGEPKLEWETMVPRKPKRFMNPGVAWNYIAMDHAIRDAGLELADVVNERTGIIVGSGGPSTRAIVEAAETTVKSGGPKKIGPFEVPKAMCSGPSAALATSFQIKELFNLVRLRDECTLHRERRRTHSVGQAGHYIRRWLRRTRLDAVEPF
jgi:3-oxoacyl-[acyl-carrier-protein] synthase I